MVRKSLICLIIRVSKNLELRKDMNGKDRMIKAEKQIN